MRTMVILATALLVATWPQATNADTEPTGEVIRVEFDVFLPRILTRAAGTFTFVETTESADRDTGDWTFASNIGGRIATASGTGWYGPTRVEGNGCAAEI